MLFVPQQMKKKQKEKNQHLLKTQSTIQNKFVNLIIGLYNCQTLQQKFLFSTKVTCFAVLVSLFNTPIRISIHPLLRSYNHSGVKSYIYVFVYCVKKSGDRDGNCDLSFYVHAE